MTEDLPTTDLIQRDGRDSLRPARPMTPDEFELRCNWYGATVNYLARWEEAFAHAAMFGLILETVLPTKKRK